MIKNLFNVLLLSVFNLFVLNLSESIDVEQLYFDLEFIGIGSELSLTGLYIFVSLCISFTTLALIYFFKPFIEVYLLHYVRYSFYLLINLLSISTIFLTFRIYGYSRFLILIYLLLSTVVFILSDKNYFINKN